MYSKWAAKSVGHPMAPTNTFFSNTGISTINAAPIKLPKIEPRPPMMIMNSTEKETLIPNASVTSAAPK